MPKKTQPTPDHSVGKSPTASRALTLIDREEKRLAKDLQFAWEATAEAHRRSVTATIGFGLLMLSAKKWGEETQRIKHGEFQQWIETHTPGIVRMTAWRWMTLAEGVIDTLEIEARGDLYRALLLPEKKLDADARAIREKILSLVDGKSQKQLLLELCDVEPAEKGGFQFSDGELKKWVKKHHPELLDESGECPAFSELPKPIQRAFRKHIYAQRASTAKDSAESIIEQGREAVSEVETKIDILIIKGEHWPHAAPEELKSLLARGEEMTALLRQTLKDK